MTVVVELSPAEGICGSIPGEAEGVDNEDAATGVIYAEDVEEVVCDRKEEAVADEEVAG